LSVMASIDDDAEKEFDEISVSLSGT
jgi:hypothetical protein